MNIRFKILWLLAALVFAANPSFAYVGQDLTGMTAGHLHPISGFDHFSAMVAVGPWGGILGAPATWQLRIIFLLAMAVALRGRFRRNTFLGY